MSVSAKPLFRAMKRRSPAADARDPLDYDPTPASATEAFLRAELPAITRHGLSVWEPCVGDGAIARVMQAHGLVVVGSDIEDRGWPGTLVRSFYDFDLAPTPVHITNPPYSEINARDGHGRWLRHALALSTGYVALLMNSDWAAARINGLDELFRDYPPSLEYLCCWRIDFTGKGAPPQRNSWFVWDVSRPPVGPDAWVRRRLYRDKRQADLFS